MPDIRSLTLAGWCGALLGSLAIGTAHAQGASPPPTSAAPPAHGDVLIPAPNAAGKAPGVINPGNPDPAITVPPAQGGTMPVVPPPGTAGGNPQVVPK